MVQKPDFLIMGDNYIEKYIHELENCVTINPGDFEKTTSFCVIDYANNSTTL